MKFDRIDAALLGFALGGLLTITVLYFGTFGPLKETIDRHQTLVTECEKNIPRSIRCILTAQPETK
jgi:hypothetical protein